MTEQRLAKVLELLGGAREKLGKLRREGQKLTLSEMLQWASQAATEEAAIIEDAEKTARSKRGKEAFEKIHTFQATIMRDFLKLKI